MRFHHKFHDIFYHHFRDGTILVVDGTKKKSANNKTGKPEFQSVFESANIESK